MALPATARRVPATSESAQPWLTVVVTAYHRKQFLPDAVRSLLAQEPPGVPFEIVVLKDFADPELDHPLAGAGPPVRVFTEELGGMGAMFARAIELARGEVIAFLEDDDRFRPGKLRGLVEDFRAEPAPAFVRTSFRGIDARGQPLPSWDVHRPQTPRSRTISPDAPRGSDLAFVYHYGAHVNVSTMAIRADAIRPWLGLLREITAAPDLFLFAAAALTGRPLLVESRVLNEYRVHQSASHESLDGGPAAKAIAETVRSYAAAQVMRRMVAQRPGHRLAERFVLSFEREVAVVIYLLDPDAHASIGTWAGFVRTLFWRRQRYLGEIGLFAIYRALAPDRAVRAYRRRRFGALRRAAGAAS
ncbi:MAG TPA: glycosyltransferase family 2 protein [Thermoplasmata archaeon]|nr:glycosyltransferase family 2 protein [Thermoplasmata archaeon]